MVRQRFTLIIIISILIGSFAPAFASNVGIFGRPLGSKCGIENEELAQSDSAGGTQMCVKTPRGLIWMDSTKMIATPRMVQLLPKCGIDRFFTTKISSTTVKSLTAVATNYFKKQNLLPIKIGSINAVSVNLNLIGLHPCSNGLGAPIGDWTGSIPGNAQGAWLLAVTHKKNNFGNFHFMYVARLGNKLEVEGLGTGP